MRSYYVNDYVHLLMGRGSITTGRGEVFVYAFEERAPVYSGTGAPPVQDHQFVRHTTRRPVLSLSFSGPHFYGFALTVTPENNKLIAFPHWSFAAITAILPGVRILSWLMRRRLSIGLCEHCGYDLRATPARCPECGTRAIDSLSAKESH